MGISQVLCEKEKKMDKFELLSQEDLVTYVLLAKDIARTLIPGCRLLELWIVTSTFRNTILSPD